MSRNRRQKPTKRNPLDIHLKKRLGQHILTDKNLLRKVVESCEIRKNTTVLEIGAGVANLTEYLAEKAKNVIAVEKDPQFKVYHLRLRIRQPSVEFIYADVMDLDLEEIDELKNAEDLVIAGNIPYNISGPLIMKILDSNLDFRNMTLMLQKEVAERIAETKSTRKTNALTMKARYFSHTELLFSVPAKAFTPPPRVESSVLRFKKKKTLPYNEEDRRAFFRFLEAAFHQKRKTLINSLSRGLSGVVPKEQLREGMEEIGIDPSIRAEKLNLDSYRELFDLFRERKLKIPRVHEKK